jgi:hypothetical protein
MRNQRLIMGQVRMKLMMLRSFIRKRRKSRNGLAVDMQTRGKKASLRQNAGIDIRGNPIETERVIEGITMIDLAEVENVDIITCFLFIQEEAHDDLS